MLTVARGLFNILLLKTMRSRTFDWIYRQFHKPWDYGPRAKVSPSQTVIFLNELLKIDPEAIQGVFDSRVPCNDKIAHHPSVQVMTKNGRTVVGMLGILNGLFGKDKDGGAQIIAEYGSADGKLKAFWTQKDWQYQMELVEIIKSCQEQVDGK